MLAIETRKLAKTYLPDLVALEGLDLAIPAGSVFSLLGPNGSGKTTTVRLLNGILQPTGGEALVCGLSPVDDVARLHALAGVMTESAHPYETLDADENLRFFGRLHGLTDDAIGKRSDRLLTFLELTHARSRKVKTYSTGMKKRLLLAVALLHGPRVLFLDEPTSGLDPESARDVYALIRKLAVEEGVTTFLCTHQLRYAEDVSDLFGFISRGRLVASGTIAQLARQKGRTATLAVRGADLPADLVPCRGPDGLYRIPVEGDQAVADTIGRIVAGGGRIFDAHQTRLNLEELYFAFLEGAHDA